MKYIAYSMVLVCACAVVLGCGSGVKRVDSNEVIDLSGKWNDTDSRLVSEEMIKDVLTRPWISNYQSSHSGKMPNVIVGTVANRSHEHINTQTFIKDLERELINDGRVSFVASKAERSEIRDERRDMNTGFVSSETTKKFGAEIGADFMLQGAINTITDATSGEHVMFYQIDLELINIETSQKAWIGTKKIKKNISRDAVGL